MKFSRFDAEEKLIIELSKKEVVNLLHWSNACIENKINTLKVIRKESVKWNQTLVDLGILRRGLRIFLGEPTI